MKAFLRSLFEINVEKMSPFDRQVIAAMNMDSESWGLHPIAAHHDGLGMFTWKPILGWQREISRGTFPSRDFRMLSWRGKLAFGRKHADMLHSELHAQDPRVDPNAGAAMSPQVQIHAPLGPQAVPMTATELQMRAQQQIQSLRHDIAQQQAMQANINQNLQNMAAKYNGGMANVTGVIAGPPQPSDTIHGVRIHELMAKHGFSEADIRTMVKASHGLETQGGEELLSLVADIASK